jgi:hypothetical protein
MPQADEGRIAEQAKLRSSSDRQSQASAKFVAKKK